MGDSDGIANKATNQYNDVKANPGDHKGLIIGELTFSDDSVLRADRCCLWCGCCCDCPYHPPVLLWLLQSLWLFPSSET